jgi:hypothetical protein
MYIAVLKISCEVHIEVKFSFSSWLLGIMYLCVCVVVVLLATSLQPTLPDDNGGG